MRSIALDNCSAHGHVDILLDLLYLHVLFLHKNMTARLQSMDDGIIASIKCRNRQF